MRRKALAFLLTLTMAVACMPTFTLTAFAEGEHVNFKGVGTTVFENVPVKSISSGELVVYDTQNIWTYYCNEMTGYGWYKDNYRLMGTFTSGTITFTNANATFSNGDDIVAKQLYSVTVNKGEHGTASTAQTTAAEGEVVTLTPNPDDGYEIAGWISDDVSTFTGNTFVMPAKDVTITPKFKKTINSVDVSVDGFYKKVPFFETSYNIDEKYIVKTGTATMIRFVKEGKEVYAYFPKEEEWTESGAPIAEPSDYLDCDYAVMTQFICLNSNASYADPLKVCVNGKEINPTKGEGLDGKTGYDCYTEKDLIVYYAVKLADVHDCIDANNDHKCDICGKILSKCKDKDNNGKCDICGKTMSGKDSDVVDTGDQNNALPYGITMILALAGIGIAAKKRREN